MSKKILVVDDEENIVELVKFNLEQEGYQVTSAYTGKKALDLIKEDRFDLVILDLMLPEMDGFDICRKIRNKTGINRLPVIMLSAKSEEVDKVLGLEIGADDYITKPFSPRELLARVKAVLRRTKVMEEIKSNLINLGELKLDLKKYTFKVNDKVIDLTPKEFALLSILMNHPGQVFSRDKLLKEIWGYDYHGDTRTVDVHVRRLRKKIKEYSEQDYIITVRGVGYKFKEI